MVPIKTGLRILFFGLSGQLSYVVLQSLLTVGVRPVAVVTPVENGTGEPIWPLPPDPVASLLPMRRRFVERSIVQLAWEHQLPVFGVRLLNSAETLSELSAFHPDVACVACCDRRIPDRLLAMPEHGFLNVHPSLLPAFRGPAPLFWLFREAATGAMGVTVHRMDAGWDSGPIARQEPIAFADGTDGIQAEVQCARLGSRLLLSTLTRIESGEQTWVPQPAGGSTFPWPETKEFEIDLDWSAIRAFNFMRATEHWQRSYPVQIAGRSFHLRRAVAWLPKRPAAPFLIEGQTITVRCRAGALVAQLG